MKRAEIETAWRVLRAEGWRAARDRAWDRLREEARRRSFSTVATYATVDFSAPLLNLSSGAPAARLGGVQAQLLARLEAEEEQRPVALLYPEPAGWRLDLVAGRGRHERRAFELPGEPAPSPVALRDPGFERVVAWAAERTGARALAVEGLAGIPLESLSILSREGPRLLLAVHDFGLFCPRPHLLEQPAERFCGYCRDPERCARCLAAEWPLPPGFQERRRELARDLLARAAAVVFSSDYLRRTHEQLFGALPTAKGWVIPPAPSAAGEARGDAPTVPPRHLALVGGVQAHKGAAVFAEVRRRLGAMGWGGGVGGGGLRWSAYGGGDPGLLAGLRAAGGVRIRGYYRAGSLPRLLRRDGVDLALLLSIVPESYSLVLSECRAAGVPVVAFDHGAVADRIRAEGGGLLVAPEEGAAGVAAAVAALLAGTAVLPPLSPLSHIAEPDARQVAARWQALYRELGLGGGNAGT